MLVLPAELTLTQAEVCLNMLVQSAQAEAGADVLVDATALGRFDSSALAVLLELRRDCLHRRKRFAVRGMAPRLQELAQLYGVVDLLPGPELALSSTETVVA